MNTTIKNKVLLKENFPTLALTLLLMCLPFGIHLAGGIVFFVAAVFFTQTFQQSLHNLKSRPLFLLFLSGYLIYVVGLLYTENMSMGLKELEYKLAFLVLPVSIAAMNSLNRKQYQIIIWGFVFAICIAAVLSMFISSYRVSFAYLPSYIELSIFHHPSYLSIYLVTAFILLMKAIDVRVKKTKPILFYTLLAFLFVFNYFLNSKIGILILLLLVLIFLFQAIHRHSKMIATSSVIILVAVLTVAFLTVPVLKNRFSSIQKITRAENIPKDAKESSAIRILIWQEAVKVFQDNPWIGVGTGDKKDVLIASYAKNGITHAYEYKLNAHNQYFEWLIAFGLLGLLFWLTVLILPMIKAFLEGNYIYLYFMLCMLIILAVESILEREAGVVFFVLFNSLLYFHPAHQKEAIT